MPASGKTRQDNAEALDWFRQPIAERLIDAEQRKLNPDLAGVTGRCGLFVAPVRHPGPDHAAHLIGRLIRLHYDGDSWTGDLRVDCNQSLPFLDRSLSLIYLLHSLDHCSVPRELLEEAARMLTPEGQLFVVALNPLSPWSMHWRWRGPRSVSASRMRRWLLASGFEPRRLYRFGPCRPGADPDASPIIPIPGPMRAAYAWRATLHEPGLTPSAEWRRQRAASLSATRTAPNAG